MDNSFADVFLQKNRFTHSSKKDIISLLDLCSKKGFRKHEEIYSPCDDVEYIYIIEKGTVELFNYTPERLHKKTFSILNRGNIFGYGEVSEKKHVLYAVSETKTEIFMIARKDFMGLVVSNENLTMDFFLSMAHQISQSQKTVLMENAREKVMNYLGWMCRQFAKKEDGKLTIARKQSIEQISNLLFLTRETTSRTLQALEDEGIISINRKTITVHQPEILDNSETMTRTNIIPIK